MTNNVLVKNLTIKLGDQTIIDDISFEIKKGHNLALVGESGSGKSVTAMSLLRLLPSNFDQHIGDINVCGVDIKSANDAQLIGLRGNKIGVIFQDPMNSLNPLHHIEKQLLEAILLHKRVKTDEAKQTVIKWLTKVGLQNPEQRLKQYPHQFSGGELQRIMIAQALINEPDLLIADEPTTALDVTIQSQILDLIKELQQELGLSILFISHDLNVVKKIADEVAVMQKGKIVEQKLCADLFNSPTHAYTKQLLFTPTQGKAVPVDHNAEAILSLKNYKIWYPIKRGILKRTVGHVKAVMPLDMEFPKGHCIGIVGESGSGKSSLAKAIIKLVESEGECILNGQAVHIANKNELRSIRKDMQYIFQNPAGSLSPRLSIAQIIAEGLEIQNIGSQQEREQKVINAMEQVDLDPDTRHRYPNEFSGGQQARIAIARAIVLEPKVLILDEPTSSLDRSVQFKVIDLLQQLQVKLGLTYLLISHDLNLVASICHKVMVMEKGHVVESGDVKALFSQPKHSYTKKLLASAL